MIPTYVSKNVFSCMMHCKGNPFYVFLFWELRGLSPNFHIHVSVSDLYRPRMGPHISSSRRGRPIVGINKSLTGTWMWKLGLRPRYSFSGNTCFEFAVFCLCSVCPLENGRKTTFGWYDAVTVWCTLDALALMLRSVPAVPCMSSLPTFKTVLLLHIYSS